MAKNVKDTEEEGGKAAGVRIFLNLLSNQYCYLARKRGWLPPAWAGFWEVYRTR